MIWLMVYVLLVLQLLITAVLCLPLPKQIRAAIARAVASLDMEEKWRMASRFIVVGLSLAVVDSVTTIQRLQGVLEERAESPELGFAQLKELDFQKQRLFRAERNMYLAGFCLTLVFAIRRILILSEESLVQQTQIEELKKQLDDKKDTEPSTSAATASESPAEPHPDLAPGRETSLNESRDSPDRYNLRKRPVGSDYRR